MHRAMLTENELTFKIRQIKSWLENLSTENADLSLILEIESALEQLRKQYRQQPDVFKSWVAELASLRREYHLLIRGLLSQMVDHFYSLNTLMKQIEDEKQAWRSVFLELAKEQSTDNFRGMHALLQVKQVQQRKLPPAKSSDRRQLEDILRKSGYWLQVSQVSRQKLMSALGHKDLPEDLTKRIEPLFPLETNAMVFCKGILSEQEKKSSQ